MVVRVTWTVINNHVIAFRLSTNYSKAYIANGCHPNAVVQVLSKKYSDVFTQKLFVFLPN